MAKSRSRGSGFAEPSVLVSSTLPATHERAIEIVRILPIDIAPFQPRNFTHSRTQEKSNCRLTVVMLTLFEWFEKRRGALLLKTVKTSGICTKPKQDRDGCKDAPHMGWIHEF